ncbi:glycoside hydrolase [Chlorella sorokiniana]|uniref:Alpha-galactosidase n=1 Tax=Chlorella sorokiniana TaxID=3076 RepID=A0A2P6U0E9_CHLSO|nr:glycoside hydrolase [Chlorella sorokiniana]|eukprot:PRW59770.1 glycoside hydrolase [Chlorella sorokiniana]
MRSRVLAAALVALALPLCTAHIGEEIPQQHTRQQALLGRKAGPDSSPGLPDVPAPDAEAGLTGLGTGSSLGGVTGTDNSGSSADVTMLAAGGSEFDLTGTLFNGNAQAFTQAVLASGMLQLPDSTTIKTLRECLAGGEPGASAVAKAVTACCSKVAEHLAGALLSLEAGPSFVSDLDAALKATGSYLVMDDGWSDPERGASGRLQADRTRFPSAAGIKAVADCVRDQGLLLGIYGDSGGLRLGQWAGRYTCQGFPGSYGHERQDAQTFAEWGVSLLKFDNCFSEGEGEVMERFVAMRDALLAANASIVYMLCEWVAHSWRTTFDIHASWESVMQNLDESIGLARYSGPGEWNDLDMLEVCLDALTEQPANRFLSEKEERAHFALWAILKSPLMIAADLRSMRPSSLEVLKAKEIIGINQDPLGVAGDLIWKQGPKEYQTSSFSIRWEQLGYAPDTQAAVRDLWAGEDLGVYNTSFSAEVRLHDALAFRITPLHPLPAHSEWRPWLGQPMYERHEEDESWIPPLLWAGAAPESD